MRTSLIGLKAKNRASVFLGWAIPLLVINYECKKSIKFKE